MNSTEFNQIISELPCAFDNPVYIYGLVDPETQQIRYIGKSERPIERYSNHFGDKSNCHRTHWLNKLKAKGLRPELVLLERVAGAWPWQLAERFWIRYGRSQGWPLTNNTDGGDGVSGLPAETRSRMAATWRGRKHRPDSIEKMRAASSAQRHSNATKAKMSASHTGRKIHWVAKVAASLRKLTDDQVIEVKRRLDAGEGTCDLAAEYGVHRTTISKIKMGTYYGK